RRRRPRRRGGRARGRVGGRTAHARRAPAGARGARRGGRRGPTRVRPRRAGRRARPGRRLPGAPAGGAVAAPFDAGPRLPHAAPFLLLDRVLEIGERTGAFVKLVSAADPCVGRDGRLPAAFVLEALAQSGGALLAAHGGNAPAGGYLAAVDDFRMIADVRVG